MFAQRAGGGATVGVEFGGEPRMGASVPVTVHVKVEDAPITPARIYVIVQGQETVELVHTDHEHGHMDRDHVRRVTTTFHEEITIQDGPLQLAANSQHAFEGEIQIPEQCESTYHGNHARHVWMISGGVDVPGNDPDSGWVTFDLY